MKPIIVATDFSPVSLNAVNYAADLACAMDTNLVLLHVCPLPVAHFETPFAADSLSGLIKDAEEKMLQLRRDIINRINDRIAIVSEVMTGKVLEGIEEYSLTTAPYAIIMGTQGTGAMEKLFFGSNSIAALKNLSWPLIVVPPEAKFKNIMKIGIACDLKKVVETAPVDQIKVLMSVFQAELHVIHVNRESEKAYSAEKVEESGLLQEMLEDLHPVYHFLNYINIDEGLNEFSQKNDIDLLIIIPKKHNLIDKIFHKSHSKHMITHTHVPVMSVHE